MRGRGSSHCRGNRTQVARAGYGKSRKYFDRALAVARQQQTKSWELRAAMSMARLWRDQGKVHKLANCSLRSTVGSRKGLTRAI